MEHPYSVRWLWLGMVWETRGFLRTLGDGGEVSSGYFLFTSRWACKWLSLVTSILQFLIKMVCTIVGGCAWKEVCVQTPKETLFSQKTLHAKLIFTQTENQKIAIEQQRAKTIHVHRAYIFHSPAWTGKESSFCSLLLFLIHNQLLRKAELLLQQVLHKKKKKNRKEVCSKWQV